MGLAKLLSTAKPPQKLSPKDIGQQLISSFPANDLISNAAVTDQGFITINIAASWLSEAVKRLQCTGVTPPQVPKESILVDFSSPNIAKEMHVGHLRSTIIGECICRLLEFVGHDVKRINHVGDWGTQFGMLILYMKINFPDFLEVPPPISDLAQFYKAAKAKFDADPEFKEQARLEVVKLQSLDSDSIRAWKLICDLSRKEFEEIYTRLQVRLDERGESFYNPMIPDVLELLRKAGQIEVSDGAEIIVSKEPKALAKIDAKDLAKLLQYFVSSKRDGTLHFDPTLFAALEETSIIVAKEGGPKAFNFAAKEQRPVDKFDTQKDMDKLAKVALPLFKTPLRADLKATLTSLKLLVNDETVLIPRFAFPLIARKSDGGYTYDTTDLAAAHHRFVTEAHKRVVYITDLGQFEHFNMVLTCARDMGWLGTTGRWDHAGFGLVSGEDGKKLKTRSGETTKLKDLLDEAVDRARENLVKREAENPQGFSKEEIDDIARKIGYGAVKYFDLKQNRTTDYQFSYDKMLDFSGNTAVFQLYSFARICSIKRKAGVSDADVAAATIELTHEKERLLALALLKFEPTILKTVDDLYPHHITDFCYELVNAFSDFYQSCRVNNDPAQNSRLALIDVVGATLQKALELLSIEVAQRL